MEKKDITIEELIDKALGLLRFIKKNVILLLIFSMVFCAIGYLVRPKPVYEAKSLLMLKNAKDGAGGLLSMAASSFGLGSQEGITFDKFKSIGQSRNIKGKVLLTRGEVNGKIDYIANHVIDELELRKKWMKNPKFANVNFGRPTEGSEFFLNKLKKKLDGITTISETKEKFVEVKTNTKSQELSMLINKSTVSETIKFYSSCMLNKDLNTKRIIDAKIDSIKTELSNNEVKFAQIRDENIQTVKIKGHLELLRTERKMKILNDMYGEAIKQNEIVGFRIMNYNPEVDIVDSPALPLDDTRVSFIVTGIIFSILGFVIGLISLLGIDFYQKSALKKKENLQSIEG